MPSKPKKPCSYPLCPNLTTGRYCERHSHREEQERAERQRHYDEHARDKRAAEFYRSAEWQCLRKRALARDFYLCQDCLEEKRITTADVVDHIKPIRQFWHLRLVMSNTRSLCHGHHNRKTAEDRKKYGSAKG